MSGYLYLLHWSPPLEGGQNPCHYLGWTNRDVEARVLDHLNDGKNAARIVVAAVNAGREVHLAKVWPGTRADEARLKRAKNGFRHICPDCQAAAQNFNNSAMPGEALTGSAELGFGR